ncbi:MAG: hypothetical protein NZ484_01145 [Patescibacteria group bacterium]|nr:hypothetical protein [Patescibacteria group bacterium]MCX7589732.1 hypothetical protein [Patescibacteria group bacterium]MDW8279909.1 hypothetical protein [bacterium]
MESTENKPKIYPAEALIVGLWLFALPDAIEFLFIFFGLDDFGLSDMLAFPGSMIYLKIKGLKTTYSLIANIVELIPYVGFLPLRTIGFTITAFLEINKEKIQRIMKKTEKGLEIVEKTTKLAKVVPAARPYVQTIEKGAQITKKTIETARKIEDVKQINQKFNSPQNKSINNTKKNDFMDVIRSNSNGFNSIENLSKNSYNNI